MNSEQVETARELGHMVGEYYKALRKEGIGRHLAASLTVDYSNMLLKVMLNAVKGEK